MSVQSEHQSEFSLKSAILRILHSSELFLLGHVIWCLYISPRRFWVKKSSKSETGWHFSSCKQSWTVLAASRKNDHNMHSNFPKIAFLAPTMFYQIGCIYPCQNLNDWISNAPPDSNFLFRTFFVLFPICKHQAWIWHYNEIRTLNFLSYL